MLVKVPGERHGQCGDGIEPAGSTPALRLAPIVNLGRGIELAQHKQVTIDTSVQVYFVPRKARGKGGLMKIRIACCVSIFRKALTCHKTPRSTETRSRYA